MKLLSASLAALAAGVIAEPAVVRDYSSPEIYEPRATSIASPSFDEATATAPSIAATTTPSSHDIAYEQWQQLPDRLKQFIFDSNPKERIQERQNAAQGGGQAAAPLSPTQLSPTTIYNIGQGEMTYTQTFAPTPSQFPNPGSGTIGMGTIQGQVGKTKTYNNPAPTASVDHRVMLAVAGGIGAGIVL